MTPLTYNEKRRLIEKLSPCKTCETLDDVEVSNEMLNDKFVVWCGCGNGTDSHDTLQDAINAWSTRNK